MADASHTAIRPAKAPQVVLMCGKCSRKLGPAGKVMRKSLRAELKSRRWGKVRLVKSTCLSLCPKRRQVLASGRSLRERQVLVVDEGAEVNAILAFLLGTPHGKANAASVAERAAIAAIAPSEAQGAPSGRSGA
jgi:hypothetical protein